MRSLSAFDVAILTCIALVAGLEVAIELQRYFPESEALISTVGWVRFAPFALLALSGCLWLCQLFLPPRRTIEILAPLEDEIVPHAREVRGSIWPPSEPVQVFVLVGSVWQPQQMPTRDGAFWCVRCSFGAETDSDSDYRIAAISRKDLLIGSMNRLPRWLTTSSTVRVRRSQTTATAEADRQHSVASRTPGHADW